MIILMTRKWENSEGELGLLFREGGGAVMIVFGSQKTGSIAAEPFQEPGAFL